MEKKQALVETVKAEEAKAGLGRVAIAEQRAVEAAQLREEVD